MKLRFMKNSILITGLLLSVLIAACSKSDTAATPEPVDTAVVLTPYELKSPSYFPKLIIPEDNKPYVEKIRLGRMLYYDQILSNDGRSCASCHIQSKGFTVDGLVNNMPVLHHANLAWNYNFMWDGSKSGTVEDLMLFEVKDFFGTDLSKLNSNATYKALFNKYFGVNEITYKELSYALAQFVRTMISSNTRFDRYLLGQGNYSLEEVQGFYIFFSERGDCYHCHVNPMFTDNQLHNIGIDSIYSNVSDKGLFNVTGDYKDIGKFRTPNLRNVALRSRFMHDGRFKSLEEVIEFYNTGVHRVDNLDPIMTKPGKEYGLQLSAEDKQHLLAFLRTLTDSTFINDTALSRL